MRGKKSKHLARVALKIAGPSTEAGNFERFRLGFYKMVGMEKIFVPSGLTGKAGTKKGGFRWAGQRLEYQRLKKEWRNRCRT